MIIRKLSDSEPGRTEGEKTLLAGLSSGEVVEIGGTDRPGPDAGPERQVRAAFLRYLLLGGCEELGERGICIHEKGVQLRSALVTGHLDLEGCRIPRDLAAFACHFDTAPTLRSAVVDSIFLNRSSLPGLTADGLDAKGGVFLRGATVMGEVHLVGATMSSELSCNGATLTAGEGGDALCADSLDAKGGIRLGGATVTGQVRLVGATLGGDLSCDGATLAAGEGEDALLLDGLVANGIRLDGATVAGQVRLLGAKLGNDLSCTDATLTAAAGGRALSADRLDAKGSVVLRSATVVGEVRLVGTTLGGDLYCDGATLTAGEGGDALCADRLDAKGSVFLSGATVTGQVKLQGATLGADLYCDGATLTAGEDGDALRLDRARIGGAWFWEDGASASGILSLTSATIVTMIDDPACWPEPGRLLLDRCRYGAFGGRGVSGRERCDWLGRQHPYMLVDFRPQPWEQCAKVLREMGHSEEARTVLIEKEWRQRRAVRSRKLAHAPWWHWIWLFPFVYWLWIWDHVLGATIRYGRRPLFAAWWLVGFWLLGTWVFHQAWDANAMKPKDAGILASAAWTACSPDYVAAGQAPPPRGRGREAQLDCFRRQPEAASYPLFNPLVYSLDTLLPIVSFEAEGQWTPNERVEPVGRLARWYLWWQIFVGWALSLLAVAGFSGLVKSD